MSILNKVNLPADHWAMNLSWEDDNDYAQALRHALGEEVRYIENTLPSIDGYCFPIDQLIPIEPDGIRMKSRNDFLELTANRKARQLSS